MYYTDARSILCIHETFFITFCDVKIISKSYIEIHFVVIPSNAHWNHVIPVVEMGTECRPTCAHDIKLHSQLTCTQCTQLENIAIIKGCYCFTVATFMLKESSFFFRIHVSYRQMNLEVYKVLSEINSEDVDRAPFTSKCTNVRKKF